MIQPRGWCHRSQLHGLGQRSHRRRHALFLPRAMDHPLRLNVTNTMEVPSLKVKLSALNAGFNGGAQDQDPDP